MRSLVDLLDDRPFEIGEKVFIDTPISCMSGVVVGTMSILAMRKYMKEVPVTYIVVPDRWAGSRNPECYVGASELSRP